MAQTSNPTPAQLDCMLGGGPSCVIVISPPTGEETAYVPSAIDHLKLPTDAWKPLPRVSRLGIDLLYAKPDTSDHPLFRVGGDASETLAALTLDCDPTSASFGISDRTAMGGVAFRFGDNRQKLTKAVLKPLEMFITERMAATRKALAGPEGISGATKEYEQVRPKAFKIFFKAFRAKQESLHPGMGWSKIECPVNLTAPSCEACGLEKEEREGDIALMACGRCKKVIYCGKSCQSEDWKAHKPFCSSK